MTESKKIKNPFPGLRPFETDEYRLFFGREGQSDALIARLQRTHFLAVVGTSGSGKSSLVRAGLLPALRGGMMAGAGSGWRIAIMRPGSDPIGNLALALADEKVLLEAGGGLPPAEAQAVIEATLRRGSLGLVETARQARLGEHEKLLVVVDQFEELFRFRAARAPGSTGDDASAFVKLLLEASQQRELPIYVVPTMRSDFLGDCAQFQGLPEAINDGQYLIPRMTRDERRVAITGPVGVTRGKITEPLVNRLMNDVGDNPDQLPILQHALMRTWYYWDAHRRNGEPIGLEQYEAIGTMSDALSKHADEAFDQLPDGLRPVAESLFKTLTERGADNREIRRPTCLQDICEIAGASVQEVGAVIDVFRDEGCSFLMPPAGVALQPETVIDISHESLIRNWRRLQRWVNEEAQSARVYRRLAEAAVLNREGSEGLLQDPGLQLALDWRDNSKPNAAWAGRYHPEFKEALAYLEESRNARDAALAERERQRQQEIERDRRELEQAQLYAAEQTRAAQRMRRFTFALVLISLLALTAASASVYAFTKARQSQAYAFNQQKKAETLSLNLQNSSKELADNYYKLKAEKTKADRLANSLKEEQKRTESALTAEKAAVEKQKKALIAQKLETERANKQTQIAAKSEKAAQKNFEVAKAALERSSLIRRGLEDLGRENYKEALRSFDCLKWNLRALPDAPPLSEAIKPPCKQTSTSDKNELLAVQLAWVYSKLGRTNSSIGELDWSGSDSGRATDATMHYSRALDAYSQSVAILKPLKKDDDRVMLDAYHGLAHAYLAVAQVGYKSQDGVEKNDYEAYYKNAEELFRLLLEIQKRHIDQDPSPAAIEHLNLARLYRDRREDEQAVNHFKSAAELWKKAVELRNAPEHYVQKKDATNQEVLVLRELAEFYSNLNRPADAEGAYDQIIDIQENYDVTRAREIADSYSELGQIYQAQKKAEKADAAFRLANMLQQATLINRREETEDLCDTLVNLAPVYVKLGRYVQARQAYDIALNRSRKCMVEKAGEAENILNEALAIRAQATSPTNWEEEDAVYKTLIKLKRLQKRETEINQIYDRRLENMTKRSGEFIGQYAGTWDKPPFTAAYVRAAGEVASFYESQKRNDRAEVAYRLALKAFVVVKELSNVKLLGDYADILSAYQTLLVELKRPDEAATVAEAVKAIKAKLKQLEQPEQAPPDESPSEPTPTPVPR